MLRLTGEVADGWLGTSFVPEGAKEAYSTTSTPDSPPPAARADLDVSPGRRGELRRGRGDAAYGRREPQKELAFSLGGMGSATTNFYSQAYSRRGWSEVAAAVRAALAAGDRDGAAALVTDDMVLATTLIGTEDMVRARAGRVAGRRRRHRPPLPGGRHPRRAARHPRAGHRARAGGGHAA
ncbi:LLM class flavin-dependent oxidoreductase [Streptomyces sp. KL116D]|uniref:LLM class flavin-dependent oxidoreductase n=1 Tax=Streptomyces sp. KL116D TaxID=3045152 RepID=UPI003558DE08